MTNLHRSLRLRHVVLLGLAYLTPMTVFDTYGIVAEETGGHVPAAYLLAMAAILFTAVSYGKMVKLYPKAGSAYSYTRETIHPYLGFIVGWLSMLDYILLPLINVMLIKVHLAIAFPAIPSWIWVVIVVLFITLMNVLSIEFNANFDSFLVLFQIAVISVFISLTISQILEGTGGQHQLLTAKPFYSQQMDLSAILAGASILCFSFLGFDALTTYAEETIHPTKTIPRGILLVVLIGGAIFIVASYFTQTAFPDISLFNHPHSAADEIAHALGAGGFHYVYLIAVLTGTLASGLASHASASRLLFVMGRENVLPRKIFGNLHPRYETPVMNVIIIGIVSLCALFLDLKTAVSLMNFGALTAFTAVNFCVVVHFIFREKNRQPKAIANHLICPLIGAGCVIFLWFSLDIKSILLGIAWGLIGLGYLTSSTQKFTKHPPEMDLEEAI